MKSWMDGVLFNEWTRELDHKFTSAGRHDTLLVDNYPIHPMVAIL